MDSTFHHQPKAGGPPFSPERETCCILSVNQLLHACLLTKWKKCNILSLFLQIHIVESTIPRRSSVPLSLQKGAAYGMLPICKAFVCLPFYKRLFHIPLQSSWGVRGLWASAHQAYFPSYKHTTFYFPPAANKDRAVNSMEIKDFIILWTYSQWRQAISTIKV